jgi:hypothetical protein
MGRTVLALLVLLAPAVVHAQDDPKVGVTMGYPGAIGVQWQVSDAFALRPEITFSRTTGDSTGSDLLGANPPVTTEDTNAVGAALSALVYVGRKDALRPYISPRIAYSRSAASASTNTNTIPGPSTSDSTISSYSAAGSFGAQYALGRRFSVFGELGASYTRTTTLTTSTFTTTSTTIVNGAITQTIRAQNVQASAHANVVTTRTAVGVIVYF